MKGVDMLKKILDIAGQKKPPAKIGDLTPELKSRWEAMDKAADEFAKAMMIAKSKCDGMANRFWADVNDHYNTHDTENLHVWEGQLFKGTTEETDHSLPPQA